MVLFQILPTQSWRWGLLCLCRGRAAPAQGQQAGVKGVLLLRRVVEGQGQWAVRVSLSHEVLCRCPPISPETLGCTVGVSTLWR